MDSRWLGVTVLVIIVALGGWYAFSHPTTGTPAMNTVQATTTDTGASSLMPPAPATVTYTDTGFSPTSITVAEGQSVTFTNQSSESMWVASNQHPSHTGYDGTNRSAHCAASYTGTTPLDECAAAPTGGSYTFTFTKTGSWGYHNHANASMAGTIIVTPAPTTSSTTPNVQ